MKKNLMNYGVLTCSLALTSLLQSAIAQTNTFPSTGNVGIGTTTPSRILHIVDTGSTNVAGLIVLNSPNMPATGSLTGLVFGKNAAADGNQTELRYEYYGDYDNRNGYAFGMNNIQPFVRFTRNSRVSIGNVGGLGASQTPASTLDVQGDIRMKSPKGLKIFSGNSQTTTLSIGRNTAEIDMGVAVGTNNYLNGTVAGDGVLRVNDITKKLVFGAGIGVNSTMVITGQNVGIGTTTPGRILDIVDTGSTNVAGLIVLNSPNMPATGSLTGLVFGKNAAADGNQTELRYEYYGDFDNRNGYAFGMNNIQPFVRFTRNQRVSIGGNASPGGQFQLSKDQGRKPSTSTWTITSDIRLKNVDGVYTKGLKEIMLLNPIMYHYKNVGEHKFDAEVLNTQAVGFSAQEVKKIFPECVGTDEDGYLNLNLHAILIAQINAIKEQQYEIEFQKKLIGAKDLKIVEMQNQLNEMQQCVESLCNSQMQQTETKTAHAVAQQMLFQNQPNPFNQSTVIRYELTDTSNNGKIIIRDLNGNLVKAVATSNSGKGQVTINANELAAGTYTYTLEINNESVDTKLMVVTK